MIDIITGICSGVSCVIGWLARHRVARRDAREWSRRLAERTRERNAAQDRARELEGAVRSLSLELHEAREERDVARDALAATLEERDELFAENQALRCGDAAPDTRRDWSVN